MSLQARALTQLHLQTGHRPRVPPRACRPHWPTPALTSAPAPTPTGPSPPPPAWHSRCTSWPAPAVASWPVTAATTRRCRCSSCTSPPCLPRRSLGKGIPPHRDPPNTDPAHFDKCSRIGAAIATMEPPGGRTRTPLPPACRDCPRQSDQPGAISLGILVTARTVQGGVSPVQSERAPCSPVACDRCGYPRTWHAAPLTRQRMSLPD